MIEATTSQTKDLVGPVGKGHSPERWSLGKSSAMSTTITLEVEITIEVGTTTY